MSAYIADKGEMKVVQSKTEKTSVNLREVVIASQDGFVCIFLLYLFALFLSWLCYLAALVCAMVIYIAMCCPLGISFCCHGFEFAIACVCGVGLIALLLPRVAV